MCAPFKDMTSMISSAVSSIAIETSTPVKCKDNPHTSFAALEKNIDVGSSALVLVNDASKKP